MSELVSRWRQVQDRIRAACDAADRDPASVTLVAVSKTFGVDAIQVLADAGQQHFGESYAQELRKKSEALPHLHWHFIGRIQSNKVRWIAPVAHRVHAVSSLRHAEAMAKKTATATHVLLAVNLGNEPQKDGVAPSEALDLCRRLTESPGVELRGLMCIPPPSPTPAGSATWFTQLAELAARGRAEGLPLHELSMGMTSDFETAIHHGATWVRVGSAIFGPRARR